MKNLLFFGIFLATLGSAVASAMVSSVDAGLSTQTIIGVPGYNYESKMGFSLGAVSKAKLGGSVAPYLTLNYQPFAVRTHTGVMLYLWGVSAGIKAQGDAGFLGLKPGLGFGLGTTILRLSAPNEITFSYKSYFSFQVNPELELATFAGLGLVYSMPVVMVISKDSGMTSLSHLFSIRWNF